MEAATTQFFRLEPEVAGGLGEHTEMDTGQVPPKVHRLHYEFDGWLGDEILESYPVFIVTDRVAERLEQIGATGFALRDVEISKSPTFEELHPGRELPSFRWLDVTGAPEQDDLGVGDDAVLVVSARVLDVLREGTLEHADVEDFQPPA